MRCRYDNVIGIDPDREKSGVAFLKLATRSLQVMNMPFPELTDYLQTCKVAFEENGETFIVVVEAGWMVKKSNYHKAQGHRAEKIAKDVGANHETGRKIVEMCKHYGIDVVEHHPLRKGWKGADGKITSQELASFTGLTGRTNQDGRDAALLAWYFAGLPMMTMGGILRTNKDVLKRLKRQ